ncbi:hypothetical protein, partial [uncultured Campylobacter sp.]|uniref:hypothetical protein n=1 Tax=uncultured Campylobacter sp. TaxID=218934 RepID=UPI002618F8BC
MGGRATGLHQANKNEVNIKGTPTIVGSIAGAAVEKGDADSNKVDITGATVNLLKASGVISSKHSTATLTNNSVTINSDTAVIGEVFGANGTGDDFTGPVSSAKANANYAKLIKGTVDVIRGAYMIQNTNSNYATIEGGHVTSYAYGSYYRNNGLPTKSKSEGDYVTISGGTVDKATYGAFTYYGDINGAHVNMSSGVVSGTNFAGDDGVFGGLSYDGTVNNSYLDLTGGEIKGDAIGGRSDNKDVANNYAKINGSAKIGRRLIGGESRGGTVTNSYLDLTGGEIGGDSIGSLGSTGAVQGRIIASGTKFGGNVIGGKSSSGNVTGSRVTLTNVTASKNVIGGEAQSGNTDDNQVSLIGGSVSGDVYGSKASGSATNNSVNLKGTARVDGNVYAADASSGSGNSVNFHSGSVGGTIYGLSNTSGTNNSLNVYNASTQKTAGDIANLNVLNFDGISNANGSADAAALNLTTAGNTDINNAKFQLNGIDYDPSNDSYGSLNIEEGKEYYLIKNGGDYSNFKEKAKQQTNVFNITDASTYEISLKGMLKSTDNHSIFIQGVKDTKRNISSDKNFDSEEVLKYDPDLTAGTIINVGKAGENKNFNGLDINTVNTDPAKPIKATVTLVEGNNIGTITGDDDDTLKIGKEDGSMTPGSIEAENIAG